MPRPLGPDPREPKMSRAAHGRVAAPCEDWLPLATPPSMRPRILLLNIPRLLRDLLLGLVRDHADVTELTTPLADPARAQIPAMEFDLVIVCDDPRRDEGVVHRLLEAQTHTRYLALEGIGEQAVGYRLAPRVERIDALTSERLLSEIAALRRAPDPSGRPA